MSEEILNSPSDSSLWNQLLRLLPLLGDILLLIIRIFYAIGESIFRIVVPIKPKSIQGEIVLITGSGHGMGKELALLYASRGATVVGWDINTKDNENTIKEIESLGYPKAYAYQCDVSNRENVLEVAQKVREEVGYVTILINNAGIMPTHPILYHSKNEVEKIFGINILSHFWTVQAFLPHMKKRNSGHIVALSSMAGLVGFENLAPYCSSKYAVCGMMEALFEELRSDNIDGVHLTTVCPYMVDTGLCKRPRIRFPGIMPLLNPKDVALAILNAQQTNQTIVSVPSYFLHMITLARMLPVRAGTHIKDFFDTGLDSDL